MALMNEIYADLIMFHYYHQYNSNRQSLKYRNSKQLFRKLDRILPTGFSFLIGEILFDSFKLLFFSSIVVGEHDEWFDMGEISVLVFGCCCCRRFPFCLFGVVGKVLFDVRKRAKKKIFLIC